MTIVELMQGDIIYTAYMTGVTAVVSGNLIVAVEGNNDCVTSSGKSSLSDSDIWVQNMNTAHENRAIGIALESANTAVCIPVSTKGMYIMRAGGAVSSGFKIVPMGGTDAAEIGMTYTATWIIGRALTSASAADAYLVVLLDFA